MPKVPVTTKRAVTVLSSDPLIPKQLQQPGGATRRSSRLAATAAPEEAVSNEKTQLGGNGSQKDKLKKTKRAVVAQAVPGSSSLNGSPQGPVRKKKSKARSKAPSAAAEGPAVKEEALGQEDLQISGRRKRQKVEKGDGKLRDPKKESLKVKEEAVESIDEMLASSEAKLTTKAKQGEQPAPKKKRKDRRETAGYALVGENVDDSAAARRARLKASQKRDSEPGEAPKILGAEIRRMCEELGDVELGRTAPWERSGGAVGGSKWWVGCHVSASGGVERAVINAAAIGCRAFALDTRSKLRWESPPLTEESIASFKSACQKFGFGPEQILPHGSYLINLASPDPDMASKGYGGFLAELQRCEQLGLSMYNFHPGSTTGLCTHEESMDRIAGFINRAHKETKGVTVVLENMASVGNIVGGRLWHLRYIIDRVEDKSRIGFCIDTCHLFSAGVDLRTDEACKQAFEEIDAVVGLKHLKGMHINDSKTPFDSHRDRHENIGRGSIPLSTFQWIMNNPAFQGIPLIMETPVQEREPPLNFKKSLELGDIVWKDPDGPYGVGTDRRDVIVLNSLIKRI